MFKVAFYCDEMMADYVTGLEKCRLRRVDKAAELEIGTFLVSDNEVFVYSVM